MHICALAGFATDVCGPNVLEEVAEGDDCWTGRETRCMKDRSLFPANGGTDTLVMNSWFSRCVCSSRRAGCCAVTLGSNERIRRSSL